ncbi:hypothetical protein CRG98_024872 [Punica granatum]|uniref:Uncharacterized protein n=1 Tax=Punica granatum TaxID=22663 RepID=A0A2I0JFV8_PUNGR|nr:hypothetical protein CRG98_024872 [Punica granatum]
MWLQSLSLSLSLSLSCTISLFLLIIVCHHRSALAVFVIRYLVLRMIAPQEGSCDLIDPLEHSLHAFHRVSKSDRLNVKTLEVWISALMKPRGIRALAQKPKLGWSPIAAQKLELGREDRHREEDLPINFHHGLPTPALAVQFGLCHSFSGQAFLELQLRVSPPIWDFARSG